MCHWGRVQVTHFRMYHLPVPWPGDFFMSDNSAVVRLEVSRKTIVGDVTRLL